MRDALLKQSNWQQVADMQRHAFFSRAASAQQSKRQMDDMLKALDFMCNLQPDKPQAPVSVLLSCMGIVCCHNLCDHACWMPAVAVSGVFIYNLQLKKGHNLLWVPFYYICWTPAMTASGALICKLHSDQPKASKGAKVQSESCQATQYIGKLVRHPSCAGRARGESDRGAL